MKDHPMLFSAPMVRALIKGRKTQTRRLIKPQPDSALPIGGADFVETHVDPGAWFWLNGYDGSILERFDVPIAPDDRIWVREAWTTGQHCDALPPREIPNSQSIGYLADFEEGPWLGRTRASIHMPRWASRLTLCVSDVRVERLQEITNADAFAEGIERVHEPQEGFRDYSGLAPVVAIRPSFTSLWDSINAERAPWASNPWVIAYTFEVHEKNIDRMAA